MSIATHGTVLYFAICARYEPPNFSAVYRLHIRFFWVGYLTAQHVAIVIINDIVCFCTHIIILSKSASIPRPIILLKLFKNSAVIRSITAKLISQNSPHNFPQCIIQFSSEQPPRSARCILFN